MTDIEIDQDHFDHCAEARERTRQVLQQAPNAALHRGGADVLRREAQRSLEKIGAPDDAVAFGRMDLEQDETFYIGKHAIWDDNRDPLVINWKTVAAEPYYRATVDDPAGLVKKRTFETDANVIVDFEEIVFEMLSADVARLEGGSIDDALLREMGRHRDGEMGDIVRTIQAAQYEILREDPDQLLIIEGGPGTGKSVVGLHRVSWLLYNHAERFRSDEVLVVGPTRTFVRYIRNVLPALGDAEVNQVDIDRLFAGVRVGRDEAPETARIKGELRMMNLVENAVRQRVRMPDGDLTLTAAGNTIRVPQQKLQTEMERLSRFAYGEARVQLRRFLRSEVAGRFSRDTRPLEDEITKATDRLWPAVTAETLVQELYGSKVRLVAAAGDEFTGRDIELLHRQAASKISQEVWSPADVAVLDFAASLIDPARIRTYSHIVVDEAQDLSPMQAEMISRRSRDGSMTILGDIHQSTGAWARDSWDDLIETLQGEHPAPVNIQTLRYGFRVPRQVFEMAVQVLKMADPDAETPEAVREGPNEPAVSKVSPESLPEQAVDCARQFAADGLSVGLICPDVHWGDITAKLDEFGVQWANADAGEISGSITVVRPESSKGLEFDAVVVVDPQAIDSSSDRGRRLLYIVLTRTTTELSIVRTVEKDEEGEDPEVTSVTGELAGAELGDEEFSVTEPDPNGQVSADRSQMPASAVPRNVPRVVEAMARELAADLREMNPDHWASTIRRLAEILELEPWDPST